MTAKSSRILLPVFVFSGFTSAALLFLVEPMLAKMALPLLGGTPAVWNTALVFFQAVLLAGYLYAHAATKWLGRRTQIGVHLCIVLLPLAILPLHIPVGWEPPTQSSPVLWMLQMLAVAVGLPFFVLSASTPLLQSWFAQSGSESARDPYFLYAASNAGSMVGLLSYPFLLEPLLRLSEQSHLWSAGYFLFVLLTVACAGMVWNSQPARALADGAEVEAAVEIEEAITGRQRLRWIVLAFVPSSLMMGVTTALTTDIPAIPLLWVLPLALYLLSFVLVFARRPLIPHAALVRRLPLLILAALMPILARVSLKVSLLLPLYLLSFFAVALVCHGELARSRPEARRLTDFYLWISFGGVLGGVFNALIAPVIFSSVLEFPLVLLLAAFLRPPLEQELTAIPESAKARRNDWLLPLVLGLAVAAALECLAHAGLPPNLTLRFLNVLVLCAAMLWCLSFGKRRFRFALGAVALFAASSIYTGPFGQVLHTERSFFGVSRVTNDAAGRFRHLYHGSTQHGMQSLGPAESREPLTYYTKSGPAGSILRALEGKRLLGSADEAQQANWAVVGLGAGSMACYLEPGERLTYYEIDPAVKRIALDTRYFTLLSQCAPSAQIVLGDARLKLREAADGSYDLIVLDAFSGDSIPMHLMTKEALALYLRKLAPGGIVAFHMSNNYLRLAPVFGALARDAGLVSLMADDTVLSHQQADAGKSASQWIVMARSRTDLGALDTDPLWKPLNVQPDAPLWTDDYSNLLRIIKWN